MRVKSNKEKKTEELIHTNLRVPKALYQEMECLISEKSYNKSQFMIEAISYHVERMREDE